MKKLFAFLLVLCVAMLLPLPASADTFTISSQYGDIVKGPLLEYAPVGDLAWIEAAESPGIDFNGVSVNYPTISGAVYISDRFYILEEHQQISTWRLYHKDFTVSCTNSDGTDPKGKLHVNSDNAEAAYLNGDHVGTDGVVEGDLPTNPPAVHRTIKIYNVTLNQGANFLDFIVHNYPQPTNIDNPTGLAYKLVYNCDTTPPVIKPNISGTLGANNWYTGTVYLGWSVTDPESTVSTMIECGVVKIDQDQEATDYTCSATSAGGTSSQTVSIRRDATAPIITCPASTQVSSGQTVTATVDAAISGLNESASVLSGTLGSDFPQTLSFTAVDLAGNTATKDCTFTKIYAFSGFLQPVDNPGPGPEYVFNSLKAGAAVPVKFSLAGEQGLSIFATGYPKSENVDCDNASAFPPIEETVTAGNSSLSYDAASDIYTYVWKTEKSWNGSCRALRLKLDDGSEYTAYFKLK
jgi:hypothetical protein